MTLAPFLSSDINAFTRKRDNEKIAASIPEKKALKQRKTRIRMTYKIIFGILNSKGKKKARDGSKG
ncbi:unnamed protein product [marine sediment metagenome]|uniref:Uncharacterized protein n=1 Tax=marine sediment metagenome TaxID=412755 RepID=X1LI30_9ZZZZ